MSRNLIRATLALALTYALIAGCSKEPQKIEPVNAGLPIDAGTPDAGLDAGTPDTGPVDAGPDHQPCLYDDDCAANERCDNEKGYCVPGDECQNVPGEEHVTCRQLSYCDKTTGLGCRCVIADGATAPNNGFCKRRLPACAPCEADEQCGTGEFFQTDLHEQGRCVAPVEGGQKYCLEIFRNATCGCGRALTLGAATFCYPQEPGTCEAGAFMCCATDGDCPAEHPLCDQMTGRCRDVCTYDFVENETVGCRSDLVCNVDPQFLDESSPNFGAGRCAHPCKSDAECATVGTGFKCLPEINSAPRCRPPGCLSDLECEDESEESDYRSYCQRSSGLCLCEGDPDANCACRPATETDPLTGEPYDDCKAGFKCELAECVKQNCVEQGGAELADCLADQFCCGEDRNGNGDWADDLCTNPAGITLAEYGECFTAPRPPWCASCQSNDDCNGNGAPGSSLFPSLCLDFGNGPICIYGCEKLQECPKGMTCTTLTVSCTPGEDPGTCGNVDRCVQTGVDPMTGEPVGKCTCTVPGQVGGECPGETLCFNTSCIYTQGCVPKEHNCQ